MLEYDRKKVSVKEIIDKETGEVSRIEKRFIKNVKQEEFIKVYLEDMSGLFQVKGDVEHKVLLWLYKITGWNNKEIAFDRKMKSEFSEASGINIQSISDALSRLTKKDLILKGEFRTYYKLNPKFFFKGEDIEREKILKINFEYQIKE